MGTQLLINLILTHTRSIKTKIITKFIKIVSFKMKFLPSSLLVACAITGTIATQCETPILSGGKCIAKTKRGFVDTGCDSIGAKSLKIGADGKLCFGKKGRKCLVRLYKKDKAFYKAAKKTKTAPFVIFSY